MKHYNIDNDEKIKFEYENMKKYNNVWDVEDEELKLKYLQELEQYEFKFAEQDFREQMQKELAVFLKDEKYDYVKDLKSAYFRSLKTDTEMKILDTIPDFVFWDIKTPQIHKPFVRQNRYNGFRGREYRDFFEMRGTEEYMERFQKKYNLNTACTTHRLY